MPFIGGSGAHYRVAKAQLAVHAAEQAAAARGGGRGGARRSRRRRRLSAGRRSTRDTLVRDGAVQVEVESN